MEIKRGTERESLCSVGLQFGLLQRSPRAVASLSDLVTSMNWVGELMVVPLQIVEGQ